MGNGFHGATSSLKVWPTTTETPTIATIWDRTATTQPSRMDHFPTRVRWYILRQTVMDFTTWLGMYLSGAGTGMGRRMQEVVIHADRHPGAAVFCAAAFGTTSPTTRVVPFATSTRRMPTTPSG